MKRLNVACAILLLGLSALLTGCGAETASNSEQAAGSDPGPQSKSPDAQPKDKPDEPDITVSVQTLAATDELVAGHKGEVVVMDLWALW